jgi:hypothetical protein
MTPEPALKPYNWPCEPGPFFDAMTRAADALTKRQLDVLQIMLDKADTDEGEILQEGRHAYIGHERVSGRTINALLRCCAIKTDDPTRMERSRYWRITGSGREILRVRRTPTKETR